MDINKLKWSIAIGLFFLITAPAVFSVGEDNGIAVTNIEVPVKLN